MKDTKIDWINSTWNPVTGCHYNCEFCYARTMVEKYNTHDHLGKLKPAIRAIELVEPIFHPEDPTNPSKKPVKDPYPYGFLPTLHRYRLGEYQAKKARSIFIGSMADIWGNWVPDKWLDDIFKACSKGPQHSYLFLTKNPKRYADYFGNATRYTKYPELSIFLGTTITKQEDLQRLDKQTLSYIDFLSVEPILEPIDFTGYLIQNEKYKEPYALKWLIVGAETGVRPDKVIAQKQWIDDIVAQCDRYQIPIFMKSSLIEIVGEENMRREYPKEMRRLQKGQ